MKKLTFLFFAILAGILWNCSREAPAGAADSQKGEALLTGMKETSVMLTREQMELAGVELGVPERRMISTYVECTGRVEVPPQSLASVYSPVPGFVRLVRFLPGDYVKKGTLLAKLTHPDLVRLQRDFLESKSRLPALESDFKRKESLLGAGATSERALEQARADYEMERARYRSLRAEIDLIGLSAEALDKNGEIQSELPVYAPVSGYVNQVNINLGKLVTPADLMYEIVDNSHVHLELQAYAKDIGKIRKEQHIEAWMPGDEQRVFEAEVHLIGRMINPETKTTLVHGHFLAEPVPLTPGSYMHAHIYTDETEAQAVPLTAVVRQGEKAYVFVYRHGNFTKQEVTLGRTDRDFVEITGLGLGESDQVALKGAYYINGSIDEE